MSPAGSAAKAPKSPPIQKKILHAGRRPDGGDGEIKYQTGTKVSFHFTTHTVDGVLLDDSRKWDKPMEIILGKKFKLEVWELCLQAMAVQEVARFRVKRSLTYNYPTVAKTLRDAFGSDAAAKKKKAETGERQHMCGMMAMQMQGGLGYDDLNQLMKARHSLKFSIRQAIQKNPFRSRLTWTSPWSC